MHIAAAAAKASTEGQVFGALGSGGIALALTALLILGIKGGGTIELKSTGAMTVAFLAGTAYVAAGKIWANPQAITQQGLTGLGVGTGDGPFGDVGIGAVALLLLIVMLAAKLKPAAAASIGLAAAFVWPAAGDGTIWAAPVQLGAAALLMVGA